MSTVFHGQVAISDIANGQAVYAFTNTVAKGDSTVSTIKIDTKEKTGVLASWGIKNDYPQEIMKAVKKNGSASSALRFLTRAHYGNGIILQNQSQADLDGKKAPALLNLAEFPEVNDFFKLNQIPRFAKETILDLEWWSLAFPEYILSQDFTKINRVKRHQTAWCRYEAMNKENGLVENIYISQKFGIGSVDVDSEFVATIPLIDSYWSVEQVKEYCQKNRIYKFARPVYYPLLDEAYYPESPWHSITKSGWLDIANSIPEYKKALFNNQVSIKYLIEIDERYFKNVYSEWLEMDSTKRIEIRTTLIDAINDSLGGNANAGKSIQSMKFVDDNGSQCSAITITAIDDKLKEGVYLPEASAANSEILVAVGVDATLIGGAGIPGGSLGAGSGSDKREAFTILSALMKTNRETSLEPLEFIQQYNGWDPSIKFAFENTILTTLDKNPTGTQTVAQ